MLNGTNIIKNGRIMSGVTIMIVNIDHGRVGTTIYNLADRSIHYIKKENDIS